MELIERYVYAVQRALPQSQREEVAKELRSDIQDMMEHEKGNEGDRIKAVLTRLGRPEDLALRYSGSVNYLIGPKWFGTYLAVLKKVAYVAVPVIFVIQLADVVLGGTQPTVIEMIIEAVIALAGTLVTVLFWVTAVFAILERSESHLRESDKKIFQWSVDSLPELPVTREVKLADSIANIVFYAAMVVLLALTATVLGVKGDAGQHVSFFNPDLWSFWLPAVIALLVGMIGVEIATLRAGKRSTAITVLGMIFNTGLAAIVAGLYFTGNLVNPQFASRAQEALGTVSFEWLVLLTVGIYLAGYVWDMITAVRRLVKQR